MEPQRNLIKRDEFSREEPTGSLGHVHFMASVFSLKWKASHRENGHELGVLSRRVRFG
jgi:hypothetical protein